MNNLGEEKKPQAPFQSVKIFQESMFEGFFKVMQTINLEDAR